jgi:hypothetical protein
VGDGVQRLAVEEQRGDRKFRVMEPAHRLEFLEGGVWDHAVSVRDPAERPVR